MIVGINARVLATDKIRGWSRYTYNLILGLHKRGIDLRFFSDIPIEKKWIPEALHSNIAVASGRNYLHWEQMILPKLAAENKVDILHCPTNYGLPVLGKFKKVLTLHDAIDKSYYDRYKTLKEKWSPAHLKIRGLHYLSQNAADKIITVSRSAKSDIVSAFGVQPEKIEVIYEAAEESFAPRFARSAEDLKSKFGIDPGYYFYVGGLEKRKNVPLILEMAKRLQSSGTRFVIAGGDPSAFRANAPANVEFSGYVDEEWLPSFYHHSKALVYPSFQEGFGLQIVEAMAMNRPALYANTSSLGEIYGCSDFGFDPYSVEEAVAKLKKLEANYEEAVAYAETRKRDFTWDKTAEETIALYKSL